MENNYFIKKTSSAITILCCLFFLGCGTKTSNPTPKDIIPKGTLESLLYEFHILEGYQNSRPPNDTMALVKIKHLRTALFKKYHTDSLSFAKTLEYYHGHPEELAIIYQTIDSTLKKQKRVFETSPTKQ